MLFDKVILYKGSSINKFNKIINILEINNINYTDKTNIKTQGIGAMLNKIQTGTMTQNENIEYEYIVLINKNDIELATSLIKSV